MKRLGILLVILAMLSTSVHAQRAFAEFPWSVQTAPFTEAIDGALIDAPDNTPRTAVSYPVAQNQAVFFQIKALSIAPSFSGGAAGEISGLCARATNNVVCLLSTASLIFSSFSAPQPSVTVVANTVTQSMDVVVTGKAGQPLGFYVSVHLSRTN